MKAEIDVSHIEETYNEFLLDKLYELFGKEEAAAFMIESDKPRPTTIRVNTLLEKRGSVLTKLSGRGVNIEPLDWSDVGAVVYNADIPIGATLEYLAGYYTVQGASSFLPVMTLDPQEGEVIVDLCAAPGGKTSYIAAMMKNTGTLYANDLDKERCMALVATLQRMGVRNAICTNIHGMIYPIKNVTRVLLDAPCLGTGVLWKDQMGKRSKDKDSLERIQQKQQALILKAFDMLDAKNKNATLVYSTCSILVEENEYVVNYLLKKRKSARVVDTGLPFGREGMKSYRGWVFHPSLTLTRRFYPHVHNMDGFFVAKIVKIGKEPNETKVSEKNSIDTETITNDEARLEEKPRKKRVKKKGIKARSSHQEKE